MNYTNRLSLTQNLLAKKGLDAVLVSSVSNITYLTGFSSFSEIEREAFLLITPSKQYIITDGRYSEAVHRQVPHFELILRSAEESLKELLTRLSLQEKIATIGFEEDNITVSESKILSSAKQTWKHFNLNSLRVIKDAKEIETIKTACEIGDTAFEYILGKIQSGQSEKELAYELELFIKKQGVDSSFNPIVAFGANSSIPHHQTGDTKLIKNSIVLLDFGVKHNNYCSDMTRTIFFGKAPIEFQNMYETVKDAQQKSIDFLTSQKKKIGASEVDAIARAYIESKGYPTIPHSLGHGIGIEVHESPRLSPNSKEVLETNMMFSVEPGIYLPAIGGVRIEDLVVLHEKGAQLLTRSKRTFIEI